jgi:hypothetical protein
MRSRVRVAILVGLLVAISAWVFALWSASWAGTITEPMFLVGKLLVLALTPAQHSPDLALIVLGYAVNFIFTWFVMAFILGAILRLTTKGRTSA